MTARTVVGRIYRDYKRTGKDYKRNEAIPTGELPQPNYLKIQI
jgi:hypothetical protein